MLGWALYWNDFLQLSAHGFRDPRLVDDRRITIDNAELSIRTGNVRFYSATYRLFKLIILEPACEVTVRLSFIEAPSRIIPTHLCSTNIIASKQASFSLPVAHLAHAAYIRRTFRLPWQF